MRSVPARTLSALALSAALSVMVAPPAAGDTVYLTNGRSFQDVVATVGGDEVTIHLAFGTLRLPMSRVDRVESSSSSVEEYLHRLEELQRSPDVDAADWLEMALWARTEGLDHGVREAALMAAEMDPELTGLDPLLRSLGYVFEPDFDRWIPFDDFMRGQGFVREGGLWVSRDELEQRRAMAEVERDLARERRETEQAAAQQAELDLLRQQLLLNATAPPYYSPPVYASYVGWGPVVSPPIHRPPGIPPYHRPLPSSGHDSVYRAAQRAAIISSQPGSLLPIVPQSHHGGFVSITASGN